MLHAKIAEHQEAFVRRQLASGRYESVDAIVDDALSRLIESSNSKADDLGQSPPAQKPVLDEILDLVGALPEEAFRQVPVDGAAQLDHYLYGAKKRDST